MFWTYTKEWCSLTLRHFPLYLRAFPIPALVIYAFTIWLFYNFEWYRWFFCSFMFLEYILYLTTDYTREVKQWLIEFLETEVSR